MARDGHSADPHSIGFHLSALYSPLGWKSWAQIARDWLAAQGSDEMLRAARNTLLGETWVESWRRAGMAAAGGTARSLRRADPCRRVVPDRWR